MDRQASSCSGCMAGLVYLYRKQNGSCVSLKLKALWCFYFMRRIYNESLLESLNF